MATPEKSSTQLLDEQKKRFEDLQRRRTRAQVEAESAQRALAEAQAEAQREFGTTDLAALEALYRSRESENDRLVVEFTMALEEAEGQLAEIEKQFKA